MKINIFIVILIFGLLGCSFESLDTSSNSSDKSSNIVNHNVDFSYNVDAKCYFL